MDHLGSYEVVVIGAGHAGIEAACAAAKLGAKTALFTMTLDGVGNLPCNPSIGGTAKGHLVREIDALGGVMGIAADATFLQSRMLNLGKGPAVHSLRVQTDRRKYRAYMKHLLEKTENLELKQAEIVAIELDEEHRVCGVRTHLGAFYGAKAVVIATGTHLGGRIFVGEASYASGPDGEHAACELSQRLLAATVTARIVSSFVNYMLNRTAVFGNQGSMKSTVFRYYLLCTLQMLCSYGGVYLLCRVFPPAVYAGAEIISKLAVDFCLFLLSFQIQREWVFKKR